jgi:uncharacterized protein (TIGR02266 family)
MNRSDPAVVRRAAQETRELVREALVGMQENALSQTDQQTREQMLWVTEGIADVTGLLFEVERSDKPGRTGLCHAKASLQAVLGMLRDTDLAGTYAPQAASLLARGLALLFAVCGDADEETAAVEASAPCSRKGLVLVDNNDDDEPAATQGSGPVVGERRSSTRILLSVDVGLVSESNFYAGLSMDVSRGGLFVATYQRLPVGTEVVLSFVLPDGTSITTAGEVRWIREAGAEDQTPGLGIAFSGLKDAEIEAIERFCRSRTPMYVDVAED